MESIFDNILDNLINDMKYIISCGYNTLYVDLYDKNYKILEHMHDNNIKKICDILCKRIPNIKTEFGVDPIYHNKYIRINLSQ